VILATMLQKDVKILLCKHCFESLDIVRYRAGACLCLSATMSSLSQMLQSSGSGSKFFLFGD